MDTNSNHNEFILWQNLIPEMRQEIRARMPKITQFMLGATSTEERSIMNRSLFPKDNILRWQICQTILEDMELLFGWLSRHFRRHCLNYWCTKGDFWNHDAEFWHQTIIWAKKVGRTIGKSGNLKWWEDDRLVAMLPRYIVGTTVGSDNSFIREEPHKSCRMEYANDIAYELAKNNHFAAYMKLYKMYKAQELGRLYMDYGCNHTTEYTPEFLSIAARWGRLEWIQVLHHYEPPLNPVRISAKAIEGGHLHILQWIHSLDPLVFSHGVTDYYYFISMYAGLSIEKKIELISWFYKMTRLSIPSYFLGRLVEDYHLDKRSLKPNPNQWKFLELVRTIYYDSDFETKSRLADGIISHTLYLDLQLGPYEEDMTGQKKRYNSTIGDVLTWIDYRIKEDQTM